MKTIKKRKNRKIKYNEEKYINSNYVVDGKAIIPVLLENTDDLFMKHDYKKIETSDDVCKYIEEIAYMVPMDMDIVIEIHCPKVSDEKQEKMIKALRNNYGMEIDDVDYDISKINIKSSWFAIIGTFMLVLNILTDKYIGVVLSNFICVVWWVAIWEMVELQLLDRPELKWKRLNYQQLYDANITFVFDKEN